MKIVGGEECKWLLPIEMLHGIVQDNMTSCSPNREGT